MNIISLYDATKSQLGGYFNKHGIATSMQPVERAADDCPAVYLMPFRVNPIAPVYAGSSAQSKGYLTRFMIVCELEDLSDAIEFLSSVYTGYEFTNTNGDLYSEMAHVDGELVDIKGTLVVWADVYENTKIGGC